MGEPFILSIALFWFKLFSFEGEGEPIDMYVFNSLFLSLICGVVENHNNAITLNMSPLMTNSIVENI